MSIQRFSICFCAVALLIMGGCSAPAKTAPPTAIVSPAGAIEETAMTGTPGGGAFRVWEIGRVLPGDARLTRLAFIHSGRIDGVIATVSINGQEWESPRFGVGEVGRKLETTTIDIGPDDHLISIDVFMGRSSNGGPIITKLIVRMSKQVVEVGEKTGEFKGTALCPPGRRVVGVCGRAGWFLDSIGLQTVNK